MFMPGRHQLRLVNEELDVEVTKTVAVQAGATASVAVPLPSGSLSVNAAPWAEVFLDGNRVGETPMANFAAPLGTHEIVLRHPKFGERRRTVVIRRGAPVRVGVDLRE
jgi:serine/threonine-protein kinase